MVNLVQLMFLLCTVSSVIYLAECASSIISVNPLFGPFQGGTTLNIIGSYFTSNTLCQLTITSVALISVTNSIVHNDTYMTCTMPSITNPLHVSAVKDNSNKITLRITGSSDTVDIELFDINSVLITGITPTGSLTSAHNTTVLIKGSGFIDTSVISCHLYDYTTWCHFINSTIISCIIPHHPISSKVQLQIYLNGQKVSQVPTLTNSTTVFTYFSPPPQLQSIIFSSSYVFLFMTFDRQVEIGNETNYNTSISPDCNLVFNKMSLHLLGSKALCNWLNTQQRSILVQLFNDTKISVNTTLELNKVAIRTRYAPFSKHSSGQALVQSNEQILMPVVVLESSSFIPYCGNLTVTVINSQNGGPRPLEFLWNISMEVISGSGSSGNGLDENEFYLLPQGYSYQTSISIPVEYFDTDTIYTLLVTARNFLGLSSQSNITLTKQFSSASVITIKGSSSQTLNVAQPNIIEATVDTNCLQTAYPSITFNWMIPGIQMVGIKSMSPVLQLPAYTLKENTSYLITIYVSVGNIVDTNATITILTQVYTAETFIKGGTLLTYGIDDGVILDVLFLQNLMHNSYSVSWQCYVNESSRDCDSNTNTMLSIESLIETFIPPYTLLPGKYKLKAALNYSSSTYFSPFQTVSILNDTSGPLVYIEWPINFNNILIHKKLIINAVVRSSKRAIIHWECVPVAGYASVPVDTLALNPVITNTTSQLSLITEVNKMFLAGNDTIDYSNPVSLVLPPQTLLLMNSYKFRLSVTDYEKVLRYAEIDIKTASRPSNGVLCINPQNGQALITRYTLIAHGWTDGVNDVPLYYRFGLKIVHSKVIYLTSISQFNYHNTILPLPSVHNSSIEVIVEVYNNKGSLTTYQQQIDLSYPNSVVDLMDVYNEINYMSVDSKNWKEGLSNLVVILHSLEIAENHDNLTLTETYTNVFKQSCLELILQLYSLQLPTTKSSLDLTLDIIHRSIDNIQLDGNTLTLLLEVLEDIVDNFVNNNNIYSFSYGSYGILVYDGQLILNIYEKLMSSVSSLAIPRTMINEVSRSLLKISQVVGIGICQQLGVFEKNIIIRNFLVTLKVYYGLLPSKLNISCLSDNYRSCPYIPTSIDIDSEVFIRHTQSFCSTNSKLDNYTSCQATCVITTQLHSDLRWSGNPYADFVKSLPAKITVVSKDRVNQLTEFLLLTTPLVLNASQSGMLKCVSWENNKWTTNGCITNKVSASIVECYCRIPTEMAVIDQCPSGYYGQGCDEVCPQGLWGRECSNICNCNRRGKCSSIDGKCNCDPGWNGKACETKCNAGYWGKHCLHLCLCSNGTCNFVDGSCDCFSGYIGTYCNQSCPIGTYGNNCASNCTCRNHSECDNVDGACSCQLGYTGVTCHDECSEGYFGSYCMNPCNCLTNGTVSCDHVDGTCNCSINWNGTYCENYLSTEPLPQFPYYVPIVAVVIVIVIAILSIVLVIAVTIKKHKNIKISPVADEVSAAELKKEEIDGDDDNSLTITKSKSLKLITDKYLTESSDDIVGKFREPESLGEKQRWQIIQLKPINNKPRPLAYDECSLHSELKVSYSDNTDEFEEIIYTKGVYLDKSASLKDLRNCFIESKQLESNLLYFQFLHSDTPGDLVSIDDEEEMKVSNLPSNEQTIYIQSIDESSVSLELCNCGKFAELECGKCKAKGYCSEYCQQSHWLSHTRMCRIVSAKRKEEKHKRKIQVKMEKLQKTGYTPQPDQCRCGKVTIYECSRCRLQGYCSAECQQNDWENHSLFCRQ